MLTKQSQRRTRRAATVALAALALAAPASARGADPQTFLDHAADWTSAQGFPVGRAPLTVIDGEAESAAAWPWAGGTPAASSGHEGIVVYYDEAPRFRLLSERYGRRGRLPLSLAAAAETALHELLHRLGHRDWYTPGLRERVVRGQPMLWWEEAAVEAVALDLLPRFLADLYGYRITRANADLVGSWAYAGRMRTVRQLSTFATASPNYGAKAATRWRARLVKANYERREAMIEAAYVAREAAR